VEAKCVTLVENKIALFPDAPTERGARHLKELIHAQESGFFAHAAFFVQQAGAEGFSANRTMDPEFADALEKASQAGVCIHVIECEVMADWVVLCRKLPWLH
jgi:sugar fermentation stimulation protein A